MRHIQCDICGTGVIATSNRQKYCPACAREQASARKQTPENRAYWRAYAQRPEVREHRSEYQKEYNTRPEVKARRRTQGRERALRPERKQYLSEYNKLPDQLVRTRSRRRKRRARMVSAIQYSPINEFDENSFVLSVLKGLCAVPTCQNKATDIDHIWPLSISKDDTLANKQPMCSSCNRSKHVSYIDHRPLWMKVFSEDYVQEQIALRLF